jgi:RND superfamily putative drug exporter
LIAPAVVTLLGDRAWWLPGWLDRIVPNFALEGHTVQALDEPEAEPLTPGPEPVREGAAS